MQSRLGIVINAPSIGCIIHLPVYFQSCVIVVQLEGVMHVLLDIPTGSELFPDSHSSHEPIEMVGRVIPRPVCLIS